MEGVSVAPSGPGSPDEPGVAVDVLTTEENPEAISVELPPVSGTHHYMPALDGLRALAVAAVVAYHFGFHWADGGYLGVDFFFVLSGFLITGLLIGEWDSRRTIGLRSFWFRRARRLLPAVMLLLIVLSIYSRLGGPNIVESTFKADGIATLFYYANWHFIFTHQSTSPSSKSPRRCAIRGRWPSRSSSIWSGLCSSWSGYVSVRTGAGPLPVTPWRDHAGSRGRWRSGPPWPWPRRRRRG
jgi:hypothetical protein